MKTVELGVAGLSELQKQEVISRVYYMTPSVRSCSRNGDVLAVVIAEPSEEGALTAAFESTRSEVASTRLVEARVKERRTSLVTESATSEHPGGEREPYSTLLSFAALEDARERVGSYLDLVSGAFETHRRSYPALIPEKHMATCEYRRRFPQHVMSATEVPHDHRLLHQARQESANNDVASGYMLSPAVCFHCYYEYGDQPIERDMVVDATGKCFRHEAIARTSRTRLIEFTMRELVLIGTERHVEDSRQKAMALTWALFGELDLAGRIETANDPFYATEDLARSAFQRMAAIKYELVVEVSGQDVAIASFNNVGTSLATPYLIEFEGEPAHSGCVAFGIERWIVALTDRFGPRVEEWPPGRALLERLNSPDDPR